MSTAGSDDDAPLDFQELERLRLFSNEILRSQLTSLGYFAHSYGFKHLETSGHVSVAKLGHVRPVAGGD